MLMRFVPLWRNAASQWIFMASLVTQPLLKKKKVTDAVSSEESQFQNFCKGSEWTGLCTQPVLLMIDSS